MKMSTKKRNGFIIICLAIILISIYIIFLVPTPRCARLLMEDYEDLVIKQNLSSVVSEEHTAEFKEELITDPSELILFSGQSMLPTIWTYSVCECVNTGDYEVGDIIAFRYPMEDGTWMLVGHRIIGVTDLEGNKYFKTRGDGNLVEDYGIRSEDDIFCEIPQEGALTVALWKDFNLQNTAGL